MIGGACSGRTLNIWWLLLGPICPCVQRGVSHSSQFGGPFHHAIPIAIALYTRSKHLTLEFSFFSISYPSYAYSCSLLPSCYFPLLRTEQVIMATPKIHAVLLVYLALSLHATAQIPSTCPAETTLTVEPVYFSSVFTSPTIFVAYRQITVSVTSVPTTIVLTAYNTEPCTIYSET